MLNLIDDGERGDIGDIEEGDSRELFAVCILRQNSYFSIKIQFFVY